MKLVKTIFSSGVITFIRISSGFVAGKVIAVFTGPAGVALIGAFSNLIAIILTFANGAINTGVIKYTAEYKDERSKLESLFSTAFRISIYCSLGIGCLVVFMASYLSNWIFTNLYFITQVRVLGISILLYAINSLFISILNGTGQIKTYTYVNTAGSVFGLAVTILLSWRYHIDGAIYALIMSQSIGVLITLVLISKSSWFKWSYFNKPFDWLLARKLSHYSLMAIISAMTMPVSQIILRHIIIEKTGVVSTGYWQGMMRISDGYLMLITTSLGTYYLPKLSVLKTQFELRKEIFSGYKIIIPVVLAGCLSVYFLRFFIIKTLFTSDFLQMEHLFLWQLTGDFFKMVAWILAYLMLAKAMTKVFIITEVLFSVGYVILGYFFVNYYGVIGASISFAVNYFIYMILMIAIFRKLIFSRNAED